MKKIPKLFILYYILLLMWVPILASKMTELQSEMEKKSVQDVLPSRVGEVEREKKSVEDVSPSSVVKVEREKKSVEDVSPSSVGIVEIEKKSVEEVLPSSVVKVEREKKSVEEVLPSSVVKVDREKKSVEDGYNVDNGNGYANDDLKDDSMEIPSESPSMQDTTASTTPRVPCTRRQNSKVHGIQSATASQFPFMAALLNQRYEYVCAGTVIATSMILTSAKCINSSLYYALLNSVTDKRDNSSIVLRVEHTEIFPTFSDGDSSRDVGIIYLEHYNGTGISRLQMSNVSDFNYVVDMEAFGYGLNADTGATRKLQYIGLEHRKLYDSAELKRGFFDCVDTTNVTCFKDFGGPVVMSDQLIGIVVGGQNECLLEITSKYALNKLMAEVLPIYVYHSWVNDHVHSHEKEDNKLPIYPAVAVSRRVMPKIAPRAPVPSASFKLPFGAHLAIAAFFIVHCF